MNCRANLSGVIVLHHDASTSPVVAAVSRSMTLIGPPHLGQR
jgi:hypothetical protein